MPDTLRALVAHLDTTGPCEAHRWQDWQVTPIAGGANNLLYRAWRGDAEYAIKFTIRDARQRAWREYAALCALREAGVRLAPEPLWWDGTEYSQPVVVQTWLAGGALRAPPHTEAEWEALLRHYCAIHAITAAHTHVALDDAVFNVASVAAGKALVAEHLARLPQSARPATLEALLAHFATWRALDWVPAPRALCRCDPNWRNFVCRPVEWFSVDWENSGWGDPAFELADMMVHPAYTTVPVERWEWVCQAYAVARGDATAVARIRAYRVIFLVWWAVRSARYLYEVPRGLDARLVALAPDWRAEAERRYADYLARAVEAL